MISWYMDNRGELSGGAGEREWCGVMGSDLVNANCGAWEYRVSGVAKMSKKVWGRRPLVIGYKISKVTCGQ